MIIHREQIELYYRSKFLVVVIFAKQIVRLNFVEFSSIISQL